MKSQVLAACAALGLAGAATSALAPSTTAGSQVAAWVYHVRTGEPLAGQTVVARQLDGPESGGSAWTGVTNGEGRADLGPLPQGEYEAFVVLGPKRSDPAYFFVGASGVRGSPVTVTLLFNPEID